jgi:hypothetical protein
MKNKDKLNAVINYEKDYLFDYFGFKTLEKAYLMRTNNKVIERIQHLFMRVSIGIHKDDLKSAIQSYELMSSKYFTHATPSLYHAGTPRPQKPHQHAGLYPRHHRTVETSLLRRPSARDFYSYPRSRSARAR